MKLLICTQAIDLDDPVLGFFHRWVEEFAKHASRVQVICLKEGRYALPEHVAVHSLGKEKNSARALRVLKRAAYAARFLRLVWTLRREYDAVFVHMNQEYVLLAGLLWRALGKRVYLWRNHYEGSMLTGIAAALSTKVFCTSESSYTMRYAHTVRMPVGIDTDVFKPDTSVSRTPRSVLSLGRLDESKRIHLLVEALGLLKKRGVPFTATIVGSPSDPRSAYPKRLRGMAERASIADAVTFLPGVPNQKTPTFYRSHDVFVNCSPPGMYDKTLLEAAACGCFVLTASPDFHALAGSEHGCAREDVDALAERIVSVTSLPPSGRALAAAHMRKIAETQNLSALGARLAQEIR